MSLTPGQHIHLVGIGGAGLSAIARILLGQGYRVSGSDRTPNPLTAALAHDGATIYAGHDTANVAGADAVIISSAVKPDQVEFMAARAAGIPVYKRSDIMADLMTGKQVIAVAGTAGKTTTTAMITHILIETGNDPSYIIGSVFSTTEQNAAVGAGDAFVIEADEYDNMFLGLRPNVAVVTNITWDHPDFFKTPADLQRSFEQFVDLLPEGGTLVVNVDTPGAAQLQNRLPLTISYGLRSGQWAVRTTCRDETGLRFDVWHGERLVGQGHLQVPGVHNALNALAAILATGILGVNFAEAVQALASFKGDGTTLRAERRDRRRGGDRRLRPSPAQDSGGAGSGTQSLP